MRLLFLQPIYYMSQKIKTHFESFRKFVTEQGADKSSNIHSIEAILVINKRIDRTKADILSDLRAIEGVTIVSVRDQKDTENADYSQLRIKIDTTPLEVKSLPRILLKIKRDCGRISGVTRFEYTSQPERVS